MLVIVQVVEDDRDAPLHGQGLQIFGIQPGYLTYGLVVADFRGRRVLRGLDLYCVGLVRSRQAGLGSFIRQSGTPGRGVFGRSAAQAAAEEQNESQEG